MNRQQVLEVLLSQLQQERFVQRELTQGHAACLFLPAKTIGLAAVIALYAQRCAVTERRHQPLHAAQVAFDARALQFLLQLLGGDFVFAWNVAQQLNGQQRGFQGIGALGHGVSLERAGR